MRDGRDPEARSTRKISDPGSALAQPGMALIAVLGRGHVSVLAGDGTVPQLLLFRQHAVRRYSRDRLDDDADPQFRHDMPSHLRAPGSHLSGANFLRHLSLASPDSEFHGQLWRRVAIPPAVRTALVDRFRNVVLRLCRAVFLAPADDFRATAAASPLR